MSNPVLCRIDQIPVDGVHAVEAPDCPLLLTRVDGVVRAFHNLCPHAGRRLDWAPGQFLVEEGRIVCAAHGAMFDRADGRCVSGPARGSGLMPVEVAIDGEDVVLIDAGTGAVR
jgi:nitrite reductase/ring-hydroxylating ferredoxin subunit